MPALLLSEKSVTVLKELVSDHGDDLELEEIRFQLSESLRPEQEGALYPQGTVVSHQSLAQVARWAANKEDKLRKELELCRLVRGAQIAIAMKPKPVRSPELIETLHKIQLMQEQEEYEEMTSSLRGQERSNQVRFGFQNTKDKRQDPWQTKANRTEAEEWDEVRRQLGAILNVTLSVAAVVVATWWAGGNADPIWKTLVAMPLSLLVAVAEIALYARHWHNVQMKRDKAKTR